MKNRFFVILFFLLFSGLSINLLAQGTLIDQKGGTISQGSNGYLKIKTSGKVNIMQDTIMGTVVWQGMNDNQAGQAIPNITYNRNIINGILWYYVDSSKGSDKPMTILDSFIVHSAKKVNKVDNSYVETKAKGNVVIDGRMGGKKDVVMGGEVKAQDLDGKKEGKVSRLRIENEYGVDVKSDIAVYNKLELKKGELRNVEGQVIVGDTEVRAENNASSEDMLNRPHVMRHTSSSVTNRLGFAEPTIDLTYLGEGTIVTGGENPNTTNTKIYDLHIGNTDSLILSENMYAANTAYIGTLTYTELKDTLTLASEHNPTFNTDNPDAEVHGNFRRIGWLDGYKIVFNNPYTSLLFNVPVRREDLSEITSTIYPSRYHTLPNSERNKVKRLISLRGRSASGVNYAWNIDAQYNYGWRYQGIHDETFALAFEKLMLLQYKNQNWDPNKASVVPAQNDEENNWGFSWTTAINGFGDYAIGYAKSSNFLALQGNALLEGAYRFMNERMSNELQAKNYLPMPPPDIYPYNLDPNRAFYVKTDGQFPDSVVDWVVVELRTSFTQVSGIKTFLLKTNGTLVDMYGNEVFPFSHDGKFIPPSQEAEQPAADTTGEGPKDFYVVLRHRNHSAVISDKPVNFIPDETINLNLTAPDFVMGGYEVLRPVDTIAGKPGEYIWGTKVGDINHGLYPDGVIDNFDYLQVLNILKYPTINKLDGYRLEDTDLSGTITTRDYNLIFNNRGSNFWYKDEGVFLKR